MTETLSLGPLSLLATQAGPLLTITIHAPSDSAPVGRMTLTVAEWTSLVALVDCMGAADREMTRLRNERDEWKACAARTGTERRSDEMRAIHDADSLRQRVRELTEERDCGGKGCGTDEAKACLRCCRIMLSNYAANHGANCDTEQHRLRSDLSAALVSVDAMAERIEQMRPVYEAAKEWRQCETSIINGEPLGIRLPNVDRRGAALRSLRNAIDTALAHTAREQDRCRHSLNESQCPLCTPHTAREQAKEEGNG